MNSKLPQLNKFIHSPLRLKIMVALNEQPTNFQQLKSLLQATAGNLSVQLNKLQDAGLININKSFNGNMPITSCQLTRKGKKELDDYRKAMLNLLKTETI